MSAEEEKAAAQELYARRGGNLARDVQRQVGDDGFVLFVANGDGTVTTATNLSPEDLGRLLRDWLVRHPPPN